MPGSTVRHVVDSWVVVGVRDSTTVRNNGSNEQAGRLDRADGVAGQRICRAVVWMWPAGIQGRSGVGDDHASKGSVPTVPFEPGRHEFWAARCSTALFPPSAGNGRVAARWLAVAAGRDRRPGKPVSAGDPAGSVRENRRRTVPSPRALIGPDPLACGVVILMELPSFRLLSPEVPFGNACLLVPSGPS